VKVIEIIGNQYLRILALEETVGGLQVENSLLKEKVMKLTPAAPSSCPLVGCKVVGEHSHAADSGQLPAYNDVIGSDGKKYPIDAPSIPG
jgi:hypothetical protein